MRLFFTFCIGCVLGATAVLLYLQVSGRLITPPMKVESTLAVMPPRIAGGRDLAQPAGAITGQPARQAGAQPVVAIAPSPFLGSQAIVIPVAGMPREQLRDNFFDARAGHSHGAIDIMAARNTPVLAAVDGSIRKLFTSGAGGLTIYETDPNGEVIYYYAHLERYADNLREGITVSRGTLLGFVGTTGNAPPNAPHLHFAVMILPPTKEWWKGEPVNPYPMLHDRGVMLTGPSAILP